MAASAGAMTGRAILAIGFDVVFGQHVKIIRPTQTASQAYRTHLPVTVVNTARKIVGDAAVAIAAGFCVMQRRMRSPVA